MTETKKILLIGRSGRGKSTLANVLLNKNNNFKEVFKESSGSVSETKKIQFEEFENKDVNYLVVDTPGIGDTKMSDNEVLDIIAEAVYLTKDGLSQVLFVVGGRFDQSEMATYNLLRTIIFDEHITEHTTIVRTRFADFRSKEKREKDIELMVKESQEKKDELRKKIADNQEKIKDLSSDSEEYKKLVAETERLNKELKSTLSEIIESCQGRIVHVDNKPDIKIRGKSRTKLLEHLGKSCQEDYKPEKLEKLSNEIAGDYFQYLEKKNELEDELKKLRSDGANFASNQFLKTERSKLESISLEDDKSEFSVIREENSPKSNQEVDDKLVIGEKIAQLEDKKDRLRKEIAEKERIIRQKVLKHIFSNYGDISNELGGDIFLNSVIGDHNWEKINQGFSNKELVVKWLSKEFDYEQVQKWAIALGNAFDPENDAGFCSWLRDDMKLTAEKIELLVHISNIEQLRKEYARLLLKETDILDRHNRQLYQGKKDWEDIHLDFEGYLGEEKKEKWKEAGFDAQQAKEWINIGGLKVGESKIASYAKWKGYQPFFVNIADLRKEYHQAQNWLEYYYPMDGETKLYPNDGKKRSEVKILNISGKNLEGSLTLEGFTNLHEFHCDDNELIGLKISNCPNLKILNCAKNKLINLDLTSIVELTKLNCGDNSLISLEFLTQLPQPLKLEVLQFNDNEFIPQDLSFLSRFANLLELDLAGNKFCGSLQFLKDFNQLEMLNIEGNDIGKGWEYLPKNLQYFNYSAERENCKELENHWKKLQEKRKSEQRLEAQIKIENFE